MYSFLKVVFPNNQLHQQIAHNIIGYLKKHGQAYLMTQIIPYIREEVKLTHNKVTNPKGPRGTGADDAVKTVSKDTIAKVFKVMWKSGLVSKPFRYSPVELSRVFTLRHWKATMLHHQTKDPLYVMKFLGHKSIATTLIYIQLEDVLFQEGDNWTVRVAETVDEATKLLEAGFEYVTDMGNVKLFRKRK